MSLPENVNDREFSKFVESTAQPGTEAVRVANPDGSNIGGSGGTAMLDDSAFTAGGSSVTPAGFLADDVSPDAVDENDVGAARMRRTTRAQYVEPVDQSGDSAMDDTNNALRVNVVAGGAGDGAVLDGVTSTIKATVMDTPTASPAGTDNPQLVSLNGTTLPSLAAGANNIGDVDVVSMPTGASAAQLQGDVAHDAANSGNPVQVGLEAIAHGANPSAVAAGDRTKAYANRAGVPFVIGGHPNVKSLEAAYTTAQTDVAIVTVIAGTKIVVTQATAVLDEATTVGVGFRVGFGAAVTPTTDGVVLTHPGLVPGGGITRGDGSGILGIGADGEDLRITSEAPTNGSLRILVSYYTVES